MVSRHVKMMQADCHGQWQEVHGRKARMMMAYFGHRPRRVQRCEIFWIEGVPAASMLYTSKNRRGGPVVDSFHVNRSMMSLFDAGGRMRRELYRRHRHVYIRDAKNRRDFMFL